MELLGGAQGGCAGACRAAAIFATSGGSGISGFRRAARALPAGQAQARASLRANCCRSGKAARRFSFIMASLQGLAHGLSYRAHSIHQHTR